MRHRVTRIKSEIILIAQEARKTLGELNFKLSIISFGGEGEGNWQIVYISIWSIESGEFRSARKKNIVSPTLYGFRGDAPNMKSYIAKQYSFGELEWISIHFSKSAVFSLQTLENNLTSP